MSTSSKKLGPQLKRLSDGIVSLLLKTRDTNERKKLRKQLSQVHKLTARLVEANVNTATRQYRDATALINESNKAIEKARKDLGKVANTINKITKVITRVEKLVRKFI